MAQSAQKSPPGSNRWRAARWTAATLILLVPLVAMQFTDEVNWDLTDFIFAGGLILIAGVGWELAMRVSAHQAFRLAAGAAIAAAFLLVWVNAAVGVIGSENNRSNLMFGGVLAVALIGALVARFLPRGMERAMWATAAAQVLVAVVALAADLGTDGSNWPWDVVGLTGFFTALWIASALLFRRAANEQSSTVADVKP